MGLRSTPAVVSRTMRMTNSSKLVTLLTERFGLVKVMAKGARRPRSKYGAALEPLTLIECMYYDKDTREIQSLSDAEIVESYSELKADITLLSIASSMVEIAESQTAQNDPSAGSFPLLVESLDGLKGSAVGDADKHLWRFVLRFLAAAGYRPKLDICLECGKSLKGASVFLSFADGGVLCSCTDPGTRFGMRVSPGALMVMNTLVKAKIVDIPRLKMSRAQRAEVESIALKFLSYHSGRTRPPRSLAFLRKMGAGRKESL